MTAPHRVEMPGSPVIEYNDGQLTAQRRFLTEWSDAQPLANELTGGIRRVGGLFTLERGKTFPRIPELWCNQIRIEPYHPDNPKGQLGSISNFERQMESYDNGAVVTASYRSRDDSVGGSPFGGLQITLPYGQTMSYSESFRYELVTLQNRGLYWDSVAVANQLPADMDTPYTIPIRQIRLTWNFVSDIPSSAISEATGNVNSFTFLGFAPNTLMFDGADISRMWRFREDQSENLFWNLAYNFSYRDPDNSGWGWNATYDPKTGTWRETYNASGFRIHGSSDFETLFPGAQFE